MSIVIWGYDPNGKCRSYIGHISEDEVPEFIAKAESEGWTGLITNTWEPTNDDGTFTPKRPRGRPRKVPASEGTVDRQRNGTR